MRHELEFTIPGSPRGKGRHRMTRTGHAYTPKETTNYEALVKQTFQAKYPEWVPIADGPVFMRIMAFFEVPMSASKKKRGMMIAGEIRPTKKPDTDNISKIVKDALNSILYRDDSQVVTETVYKIYGDRPRVEVEVVAW